MVSLFGFELKRIFQGRHIFLLAIFWGVILYTVYFGAMKYTDRIKLRAPRVAMMYFQEL